MKKIDNLIINSTYEEPKQCGCGKRNGHNTYSYFDGRGQKEDWRGGGNKLVPFLSLIGHYLGTNLKYLFTKGWGLWQIIARIFMNGMKGTMTHRKKMKLLLLNMTFRLRPSVSQEAWSQREWSLRHLEGWALGGRDNLRISTCEGRDSVVER